MSVIKVLNKSVNAKKKRERDRNHPAVAMTTRQVTWTEILEISEKNSQRCFRLFGEGQSLPLSSIKDTDALVC